MPYCPFCGQEISETDSFCQSCGASLGQGSPPPMTGPKRNPAMVIVIVIVGIVLLSTIAGAVIIAMSGNNPISGDIKETYRWTYNNKDFTYTLEVKGTDHDRMMASSIDRTGSVSTDRYTDDSGIVPGVCDYIVVDSYIKGVSDMLKQKYQEAFGVAPGNDEYVRFAAAFVQVCIKYDYGEAGTEYWRYPLETLCDRTGDCEDTSILLAALIDAAGIKGGLILLPSHAMCAVVDTELTSSYSNLRHSSVYGTGFYPIETTVDSFHDIGQVNGEYGMVYNHLYLGSVNSYFSS